MKWDFVILQPTFNRSHAILETVLYVQEDSNQHQLNVLHIIFDDHSSDEHWSVPRDLQTTQKGYKLEVNRLATNHGRLEHWKLVNVMFSELRRKEFDYAIILADDMRPCRGFLPRVRRHFEFLRKQDTGIIAMTLLSSFPSLWGSSRYIDGHYIAKREFFEVLDWRIQEIFFPNETSPLSSGVHKQIVRRMEGAGGVHIAKAPGISYVEPMDLPSVMFPPEQFPQRPQQCDWVQDHFIDRW